MNPLTIGMPAAGSDDASVTGSLDALGALMHALPKWRDEAPTDEWRGIVVDTQRAISDALTPFTYEDDGDQVITVMFPKAAIAVVLDAASYAGVMR